MCVVSFIQNSIEYCCKTAQVWHSQHDQAGEIGEGVVRDACDPVEGQRQGLKVALMLQGADRNLGQAVVIQPKMPELLETLKTVLRHRRNVVCVQPSAEKKGRD